MRKLLLTVVMAPLLAVLFASVALAAPAAGSTFSISGSVLNGTREKAPVAGQKVTLQQAVSGNATDLATTTADAQGRFSFANVAVDPAASYAVYTRYQDGLFASNAVRAADGATQSVTLTVYETTSDPKNLRVTSATVLVRQPRPANGLIGIAEILTVQNSGTTAFVGEATGSAGMPTSLLRFATPPNASNLSLGIGFGGTEILGVDRGFTSSATVPPGATKFAFGFDVPYTGTEYALVYRAVYPTDQVTLLVPTNMSVDPGDFMAQGTVTAFGDRYQVAERAKVPALTDSRVRIYQLPPAGEMPALDARLLVVVVAILALLVVTIVVLYLWRGDLAPAPRLLPTGVAPPSGDDHEAERQRLLRKLLALDAAHRARKLSDAEYKRRSADVRQSLRALLAARALDGNGANQGAANADGAGAPHAHAEASTPAGARPGTGGAA